MVFTSYAGTAMALESRKTTELSFRVSLAVDVVYARHTDAGLKLRQVADAVRLSTFHLSRILKRETGFGFADHLRAARVGHAELLLRTSTLTVKEVAAAVGYMNTTALDRNFMAIFSMAPSVYRRMVRCRATNDDDSQVMGMGLS